VTSFVPASEKILDWDTAVERFGRPRTDTVVFTNGCFDILHRGHVEYLAFARSQGDRLLVGLNSDRSVQALKGDGRPVNPVDDRAIVIASLESVSGVVIFDQDTPAELIRAILPDVLVKGSDYSIEQVVGASEVEAAGGRVVLAPLVPGRSTTSLIQKARTA
jgi:rfaE bifunctional protein nucleotidyltransferase chain/domain